MARIIFSFCFFLTACGGEPVQLLASNTIARVILTPAVDTLPTGAILQFAVRGEFANGSPTPVSVIFSATGGAISPTGQFVADTIPGTYAVIATCPCGPADTAMVTLRGPESASLHVEITGLPPGLVPSVRILGPANFSSTITEATTLPALLSGRYTIRAAAVFDGGSEYRPLVDSIGVMLAGGTSDTLVVSYQVIGPGGVPPHPRIWMTPARVQHLKDQAAANTARWLVVKRTADQQVAKGSTYGTSDYGSLGSLCSAYLATGNQAYADRAAVLLTNYAVSENDLRYDSGYRFRSTLPVVTAGFDWCYNGLSTAVRRQVAIWLMDRADWVWTETNPVVDGGLNKRYAIDRPTNNYWWGFTMTGPAGLAVIGDDARGTYHAALGRVRWAEAEAQYFNSAALGGAGAEGAGYDVAGAVGRFADAYLTAGQPVTSPWLVQSLLWRIHSTTPDGLFQVPFGDLARVSTAPIYTYDRQKATHVLASSGASATLRGQVWSWLDWIKQYATSDNQTMIATDDLLFDDQVTARVPLSTLPLSYTSPGQGAFVWRSDWTPSATMLAFKAGTRVEGHQDAGANGLMLWRGSFWVTATANIHGHSGIRHETQYYNTLTVTSPFGEQISGPSQLLTAAATGSLVTIRGQAAGAYGRDGRGRPVSDFLRTVAYLPDVSVAVVMDRVTIVNPADTMIVRWHGKNAPTIAGSRFTIANPSGDQRCVGDVSSRNTLVLVSEPQFIDRNLTNDPPSSFAVAIRTSGAASDVIVTVLQCGTMVGTPIITRAADAVTVSISGATVRVPLNEQQAVTR